MTESVSEPGPWPQEQRFDYVVRQRELTPEELAEMNRSPSHDVRFSRRATLETVMRELSRPPLETAVETHLPPLETLAPKLPLQANRVARAKRRQPLSRP